MKRATTIVAVLAVVGAGAWLAGRHFDRGGQKQAARGARPVAVAVEAVGRRDIERVVAFTGSLLPRARFTVAPKVPGRLERLLVDVGDVVSNGAPSGGRCGRFST